MGKVLQHNVVEKCDQWLSTRNKKKISSIQHPVKKHPSSRRKSSSHAIVLTQNSPPPPELKTNTKQSSITSFFCTPGAATPDFRENIQVRRLNFDGDRNDYKEKEHPQEIKSLDAQEEEEENYGGYDYNTGEDNCFSRGRIQHVISGNNLEDSEIIKGHSVSSLRNGEGINPRSDSETNSDSRYSIYESSDNENETPSFWELDKFVEWEPNKSKGDNTINKWLPLRQNADRTTGSTLNSEKPDCKSFKICDNVDWSEGSQSQQNCSEYNVASSTICSNNDTSYEGVGVGHDTCSFGDSIYICTDNKTTSQQAPGINTEDILDSCDFSGGRLTDRKYLLNSEEADMELQDFSLSINTQL